MEIRTTIFSLLFYLAWFDFFAMHLVALVLGCTESCTHCFFLSWLEIPNSLVMYTVWKPSPPKNGFFNTLENGECSLVVILIMTILECILPEYAA
jgi:hypothetical protein